MSSKKQKKGVVEHDVVEIPIKFAVIFAIIVIAAIAGIIFMVLRSNNPQKNAEQDEIPEYITIKGEEYKTDLTELDLSKLQLKTEHIEPLKYMTSLERLWLDSNNIADISVLSRLTNLKILDLNNNRITDLSPLGTLPDLEELFLTENPFDDLSPLSRLTSLTQLWLGDNKISDLSPLYALDALELLELWSDEIDHEQITALQAALPDCEIAFVTFGLDDPYYSHDQDLFDD